MYKKILLLVSFCILFSHLTVGPSTGLSPASTSVVPSSVAKKSKVAQPLKALHSLSIGLNHKMASSSCKTGPVKFYNRDEPYYEFTNFYFMPIQLDGHQWPTTEHYFQAQKFVGTPYYDLIRRVGTAREAFQVSRNPAASLWIRGDWERVKDQVMLKALRAKFSQSERLRKLLLETKERELVEHTINDSYWGDGGDGSGRNVLGTLLMQVRNELKDTENSIHAEVSRSLTRSNSLSDLRTLVASTSIPSSHTSLPSSYPSSSQLKGSWVSPSSRTVSVDLASSHTTGHIASPMVNRKKKSCSPPSTGYPSSSNARSPKHTPTGGSYYYRSSDPLCERYNYFRSSTTKPLGPLTHTSPPVHSAIVDSSRRGPNEFSSRSSSGSALFIPRHSNASSVDYNIISGKQL